MESSPNSNQEDVFKINIGSVLWYTSVRVCETWTWVQLVTANSYYMKQFKNLYGQQLKYFELNKVQ